MRSKGRQSVHDRKVSRIASGYKSQGYQVKADLAGRSRPPKLGGRIPDVYATKGRKTIAVEVETPASVISDRAQRHDLRNWASRGKDRTFRYTVAKSKRGR